MTTRRAYSRTRSQRLPPDGWSAAAPDEADAPELTELLRRHEERGRGWAAPPRTTSWSRSPRAAT